MIWTGPEPRKPENECDECQAPLPKDFGALCNACALRYEFERNDEWWAS